MCVKRCLQAQGLCQHASTYAACCLLPPLLSVAVNKGVGEHVMPTELAGSSLPPSGDGSGVIWALASSVYKAAMAASAPIEHHSTPRNAELRF